jgi:DNA-binding SARP family transcriptional activator
VLAGHEGVSAEALARGLWPGEGREGREKVLETTLARLRKLLGVADAVQLHDHRLRLNPLRVWIDAAMFVRVLDRIHGPDPHEASWRRAFLLYRGPLLADEPDPWVQPWRDRLRALLAAALLTTRQASGDDERWLRACAADPAVACHRAGSGTAQGRDP